MCVPNLKFWDLIVEQNRAISPIIIAKVLNEKTFVALFDIYGITYPYVFDDQNDIRKLNEAIDIDEVILIDSTGLILSKLAPYQSRINCWRYTKLK